MSQADRLPLTLALLAAIAINDLRAESEGRLGLLDAELYLDPEPQTDKIFKHLAPSSDETT